MVCSEERPLFAARYLLFGRSAPFGRLSGRQREATARKGTPTARWCCPHASPRRSWIPASSDAKEPRYTTFRRQRSLNPNAKQFSEGELGGKISVSSILLRTGKISVGSIFAHQEVTHGLLAPIPPLARF